MKHLLPKAKYLILLLAVIIGSVSSASLANAYGRTITNPADNSSLSSSVMRGELQTLENEITSAFTITGTSFATSTLGLFSGGFLAIASTTIGNGTQAGGLTISGGATTTLNAYFASNVGIGTTSPGTLLSIGGNATGINFVDGTTATSTISGNMHVKGNIQVDGNFFAPVTLVNSSNLQVTGTLLVGGATTLSALTSNGFVKTSGGTGALSVDTNTYLTGNQSITLSGAVSGTGTTAITTSYAGTLGNTLGGTGQNSSAWTGLPVINGGVWSQQATSTTAMLSLGAITMTNASTTQMSSGTNTFYVDSNGRVQAKDTTNNWTGVLSPTHGMVFSVATSTATFTATSTAGVDSSPNFIAPFAGTIRQVRCGINTWLGVNITINGSAVVPSYFVASSTVGKEAITSSNTFSAGDKILVNFGTTTSATASSGVVNGSCTLDVTETP